MKTVADDTDADDDDDDDMTSPMVVQCSSFWAFFSNDLHAHLCCDICGPNGNLEVCCQTSSCSFPTMTLQRIC